MSNAKIQKHTKRKRKTVLGLGVVGQSTVEYILILAVVVMVALQFKKKFGTTLMNSVDTLGTKVEGALNDGN